MVKTTLAKVNGEGKVNGTISRNVLERNAMDVITDRGWSFEECLDKVEGSSTNELMNFLREYDLSDDYEEVLRRFMNR